ncbi:MAG: UDP-N-acetylmuramoyl-L-alanyl-D-glutamate--2,6-diaminopimelate ligase, partial [Candidatus Tagabacteria bacterium CG_4_8_14_3_um_filter_41_8]
EDPRAIAHDIKKGISSGNCEVILDRRKAVNKAFRYAKTGDAVIITGKGAEPWIMGPKGTKIRWDDREVAREELKNLLVK